MILQDAGVLLADAPGQRAETYSSRFSEDFMPDSVPGDYTVRVTLEESGSSADWVLIAIINNDVELQKEGTLTPSSPTSAEFTVSLSESC